MEVKGSRGTGVLKGRVGTWIEQRSREVGLKEFWKILQVYRGTQTVDAANLPNPNVIKVKLSTGNTSMGEGFISTPDKFADFAAMVPVAKWVSESAKDWIEDAFKKVKSELRSVYGFQPDQKPSAPSRFNAECELEKMVKVTADKLLASPEDFLYIGSHGWAVKGDKFRIVKETPKTIFIEVEYNGDWYSVPAISKKKKIENNFFSNYKVEYELADVVALPELFKTENGRLLELLFGVKTR